MTITLYGVAYEVTLSEDDIILYHRGTELVIENGAFDLRTESISEIRCEDSRVYWPNGDVIKEHMNKNLIGFIQENIGKAKKTVW